MQKQPTQNILISALLVIAIILLAGVILGRYYASLPEHHPQDNKKNCEGVGGEWIDDQKTCILSSKKAGEVCVDGGQCESGICSPPELTDEQKITIKKQALKNIKGTCSGDNFSGGCVEQVISGEVTKESMCLGD